MTEATLEFPPIIDPPIIGEAPLSGQIVHIRSGAEPAAPDLSKVDLTAVALARFGDWKADVATARTKLTGLVLDLTTQAKVDEAKSLRHRLIGQPRAEVRKVSKALKSALAQTSKAIGAEEEAAVAAYDSAETLISPQIDARQAELDAEREAKATKERERIAALDAKLAALSAWIERCKEPGMTSGRIANGIVMLERAELTAEDWAEYLPRAIERKTEVLEVMRELCRQATAREIEAQRLEAQRLENERVAAELAEERRRLQAEAEALRQQQEQRTQEAIDAAKAMAATINSSKALPEEVGGQVDGCRAPESQPDGCSGPVPQDHTSLPASPDAQARCDVKPPRIADDGEEQFVATDAAPRDQTDAEIAAANGPEVDLPPEDATDPEDEGGIDLLRQALAMCEHAALPFAGRFPSHPKPDPAWWAALRDGIDRLQPKLLMALAAKRGV